MYCQLYHAGLDHENVGALEHVALSGANGETGRAGGQLIAAAVAERRRRLGRVAERSVERAGELGAVAHDAARVRQLVLVEEALNGANPTVHHVRGRHNMCARFGKRERHLSDALHARLAVQAHVECRVVGVGVEDATMAVCGVGAEADVAGDHQLGIPLTKQRNGANDGAALVVSVRASRILLGLVLDDAEEEHAAQTVGHNRVQMGLEHIDAHSLDARQRGDVLGAIVLLDEKERIDERRWRNLRVARLPLTQRFVKVAALQDVAQVRHVVHSVNSNRSANKRTQFSTFERKSKSNDYQNKL